MESTMKKIIVTVIALAALSAASFAQVPMAAQAAKGQALTVSGKLELIDGAIGLKSDGKTYIVQRLMHLVGFVKDLQEGAAVKLEGTAYPLPYTKDVYMLEPTKLSFNGKDYDLSQEGPGMMGGRGARGMMGYGRDDFGGMPQSGRSRMGNR
jgi:hypothetical protein